MTRRSEIARRAAAALRTGAGAVRSRQPHQVVPDTPFQGFLALGGRGSGKTWTCTDYLRRHVAGPPCLPGSTPHWIAIIAPTLGDAVTSVYEGPSGLRHADPDARLVQAPGGTVIRWPNGSQARLYGAYTPDDVERLRSGGNSCLGILEEFAAWRYMKETYDQLRFGLRSGPRPHWVAATTPKPHPLLKSLLAGDVPGVIIRHATMYDNPYLEQHVKDALEDAYAGTDLGEQELYGRLLDQTAHALWKRSTIAEQRIAPDALPPLVRRTVGVDPSGGAGEQGIVVVARSAPLSAGAGRALAHGYVLDDRSCRLEPDQWGRRAVQAAVDWDADDICVERNFGGAMCRATLATAAEWIGVSIPIREVVASTGKAVRAQPVAALAAQGRWHHAGTWPELEDQLCTWSPELGWSPDRLDAMVWPGWHMGLVSPAVRSLGAFGGSAAARRNVLSRPR